MESQEISRASRQLLPGIPDQITLAEVTTRLLWKALQILSAVSHDWREAIKSRKVYDARVTSNSTETLIVVGHLHLGINLIALYSLRDRAFYQLPPLPGLRRGVPWSSKFISLDGKVYHFGGCSDRLKVHVLDLAGVRRWKECASMLERRDSFGCGVLDGKIYVFGGVNGRNPVRGSEVYNPHENAWSSITPMLSLRRSHKVTPVGNEMIIHGGACYPPDYFHRRRIADHSGDFHYTTRSELMARQTKFWEIYNPARDHWRRVERASGCSSTDTLFMAKGVLHLLNQRSIRVLDVETNVLTHLRSISCERLGQGFVVQPFYILEVNGELFVIARMLSRASGKYMPSCLLQSMGFSSENDELVWERVQCSDHFPCFSSFICTVAV